MIMYVISNLKTIENKLTFKKSLRTKKTWQHTHHKQHSVHTAGFCSVTKNITGRILSLTIYKSTDTIYQTAQTRRTIIDFQIYVYQYFSIDEL